MLYALTKLTVVQFDVVDVDVWFVILAVIHFLELLVLDGVRIGL